MFSKPYQSTLDTNFSNILFLKQTVPPQNKGVQVLEFMPSLMGEHGGTSSF